MRNRRKFGRIAALFSFGLCVAATAAGFGPTAHAVPVPPSEAPVYAIDDYPFQKAPALLRWRSVLQREAHVTERVNPDDCNDGEPRLACAAKEAQLLEEKLRDKSPTEQVAGVYAFFNAVKYKEHAPDCGIDCWKSRLQFLAHREGDCGDHALAEYFTLRRLGFKERDLQLIVAQLPGFEDSFKGGHVVLRVRADEEYFILDNRRNTLADLSGLGQYKVLAGMNADSVQIYNLVTPAPPPGFVSEATQVAALITSPGTASLPQEELVAAAEAEAEPAAPTPQAEPAFASIETTPTLVAAVVATPEPDVVAKGDADSMCLQSAQLADWNPFLPCTEVKSIKMVIKAKTVIGAEPPKPAEARSQPVKVAAIEKAPEPKVEAPKALEPKPVAKPAVVPPAPAPKPEPVAEEADAETGACLQGGTLGDWNADLPCGAGLRIEVKE